MISQIMENSACEYGLGLCQIGTLDFERIRPFFSLDDTHIPLHALLGGPKGREELAQQIQVGQEEGQGLDRVARMIERVQQLSTDEIRKLLEAQRRGN